MTGSRRAHIAFLVCVLIGLLSWHAAGAEEYPNRPVTIVVPFTPHGSTDILGHYVAAVLQGALHQSFIVENRAGEGGLIGISYVAKSAPDGYTLLTASTVLTFLPYLNKFVSYDPAADFNPIVLIGLTEFSLVVAPSLNVNSVQDLIALAKAKPGVLTYASAGNRHPAPAFRRTVQEHGEHRIRHIPYNGVVPALPDVMSGKVSMIFADLAPSLPMIKDGKLKILAVASSTRNQDMPNVPTIGETLPGYEAHGWQGLLARAGTPKSTVDKINSVLVTDLKRPELAERFKSIGIEVRWNTPEEFRAFIASESAKWGKVIRAAGIEPQ